MYAHMSTHRHMFTHTHVYTYTYTHTKNDVLEKQREIDLSIVNFQTHKHIFKFCIQHFRHRIYPSRVDNHSRTWLALVALASPKFLHRLSNCLWSILIVFSAHHTRRFRHDRWCREMVENTTKLFLTRVLRDCTHVYKSPPNSFTCVRNYIKFLLHIRRSLDSFHSNKVVDDGFPELSKNSFQIFLGHGTSKTSLIPISDSFSFLDPKICKFWRPMALDQSQIPFEES